MGELEVHGFSSTETALSSSWDDTAISLSAIVDVRVGSLCDRRNVCHDIHRLFVRFPINLAMTGQSDTELESGLWQRLPPELLKTILGKLPLRSLLLFRSVCSSWKAMIDNAEVVYEGPPKKNVIFYCPETFLYYYELPEGEAAHEEPYLLFPNMKRSIWELHKVGFTERHNIPIEKSTLMCADGGLMCFGCFSTQFGPDMFIVYNPLTRRVRVLRLPARVFPTKPSERLTFGEVCLVSVLVGLSVDQETGNYKMVVAGIGEEVSIETYLYESSSKSWRTAGIVPAAGGDWKPDRGIRCGGNAYWHLVERDPSGGQIDALLKFDFGQERWDLVKQSIPSPVSRQALGGLHAVAHNGKLLLFQFYENGYPENAREIHSQLLKIGPEVKLITDTLTFTSLVEDPNTYKPVRVVSEGVTLYIIYEGFSELVWRILAQDNEYHWLPTFAMAGRSDIGMLCGDVGKFFAFTPTLRAHV
ncbi:hypothetical protein R1sor_017512 [Riccia sorocarpa]|uniref:F-box domain-containing protein n=1 Tax=Riccia sorocarpa TaxID=122646 RepID=A0ABD3IAN4_9MARC